MVTLIKKIYLRYYYFMFHIRGYWHGLFLKSHGKNLQIGMRCVIHSPQNITVGNNVYINHDTDMDSYLGKIVIGNDVLIGMRCAFITANHTYTDRKKPIRLQE